MTGRLGIAIGFCAAALAATGCGGGGGGSDVDVGPAAAVPGNAPIYLEATVKPEGEAATGASAALGKILDAPDGGAKLVSLIEQSAADAGDRISFAQDIDPWLGDEVGVFVTNFADDSDGALVIESTDNDAAQAFLDKVADQGGSTKEVAGHEVQVDPDDGDVSGIVGDFVIAGSEAAFQAAAEAEGGDSLGDSDDFKDSIDDLPDDSLGTLYAQPKDFLEAIPQEDLDPNVRSTFEDAIGDAADEPVVGNVTASAEDIELDLSAGGGAATPQGALIDAVPAQAWLALSIGDLGGIAKRTLDNLEEAGIPNFEEGLQQVEDATGASIDDLTAALGDSALYVGGTDQQSLNGALVIQSEDTELTSRLITQFQSLITAAPSGRARALTLPGGGTGFSFSDPSEAPQPFEVAQQGDKIAIAYGAGSAQQALGGGGAVGGQLSTTPAFAAAAGKLESLGVDLFLSFPTVFQFAESQGASQDPEFQQAKPYIDALDYLAVGSGEEDDHAEIRFIIGLK